MAGKLKSTPEERECVREDYEFALKVYKLAHQGGATPKNFDQALATGAEFSGQDEDAIERANTICRSIRILVKELGIETSPEDEAFTADLLNAMHEFNDDTYRKIAEEVAALLDIRLTKDAVAEWMEKQNERHANIPSFGAMMDPDYGKRQIVENLSDKEDFVTGEEVRISWGLLKMNCQEALDAHLDPSASVRVLNALNNAGFHYVGDVLTASKAQLIKLRNFSKKSLNALDDALKGLLSGVNISSLSDADRAALKKVGFEGENLDE